MGAMSMSQWSRDCARAIGRVDEFYVRSSLCGSKYYDAPRLRMFGDSGKGLMRYILSLNVVDGVLDESVCLLSSSKKSTKRKKNSLRGLTLNELIQCGSGSRRNHC